MTSRKTLCRSTPLLWLALCLLATVLTSQVPLGRNEPQDSTETSGQEAAEPPPIPEERATPRATFRTFLEGIAAEDWPTVIETLDLSGSGIPDSLQAERGKELAIELKSVIDRIRLVDYDEIPNRRDGSPYVFEEVGDDAVVIRKMDAGDWRFEASTLQALAAMRVALGGREVAEGVVETPLTPSLWLRSQVPLPLQKVAFLLEHWQWLGLLLLIVLGVVADRLLTTILQRTIAPRVARRFEGIDQEVMRASLRPAGLLAMALMWRFGVAWLGLPNRPYVILLVAVKFVVIFALVWMVYRMADVLSSSLQARAEKTESKFDDLLVPMVRTSTKIAVAAFGLIFIADNLGVEITTLLAGLGLGGVAVALAGQDVVKNLFGSLTVILDRPFDVGDWVVIGDVEGTIAEVGFRSTRVRTFYDSMLTLPNSNLISAAVDNYGARAFRRWRTYIAITYDTPPERIDAFCEGIRELIRRHPYTRKDSFHVYLNQFGPHSLDILVYMFFTAPDWGTELRERHRLAVDILRLAARLGVQMAFPTQTLHFERAKPDAAETAAREALAYAEQLPSIIDQGRNEAQRIVDSVLHGETPPPVTASGPLPIPGEKEDSE